MVLGLEPCVSVLDSMSVFMFDGAAPMWHTVMAEKAKAHIFADDTSAERVDILQTFISQNKIAYEVSLCLFTLYIRCHNFWWELLHSFNSYVVNITNLLHRIIPLPLSFKIHNYFIICKSVVRNFISSQIFNMSAFNAPLIIGWLSAQKILLSTLLFLTTST